MRWHTPSPLRVLLWLIVYVLGMLFTAACLLGWFLSRT